MVNATYGWNNESETPMSAHRIQKFVHMDVRIVVCGKNGVVYGREGAELSSTHPAPFNAGNVYMLSSVAKTPYVGGKTMKLSSICLGPLTSKCKSCCAV